MEETPIQSFDTWNTWAQYLAYGLTGLAVLILLGHLIKLAATSDSKTKYDYINRSEINILMVCSVLVIIAGGLYANSFIAELGVLWLFVRVFVTISMGLIIGVIIQNLLKFYYPFYIEKRLKKLRYKPRISPKTGKPMKLLSEEEEDVYLDEGMQAEEEIYSIDYDVWVDEETGYTKIEKYAGHLHALQCPECNYQTFRVSREEILKAPSSTEEGELMKHFECGYCGYKAKKNYKIAMLHDTAQSEETATA
ncbi:hypothetical protein GCM10009122_12460 [Fulvivirga kasyanovii]|uniref:Uncharacterized protein n=1 Tax=Fulvivirga kasyanovii TaxID=396812 RepID=A0ABW9RL78_9BACT|nr:hypothetical protein [Fulvivirga kasyanovii]MTI23960.1 hypothetical protein [Fulvivirga kasyanovii]